MQCVTAVLIGAGGRGFWSLGGYAGLRPDELRFVAVAEPKAERREKFRETHGIATERCYHGWEELMGEPKLADTAIICTQDRMHFEPAIRAMEKGYHVLLEKPMAVDPLECLKLAATARKFGRILTVCHVLRYTPFFQELKRVLDSGRIGRLISIQHNENVGFYHIAHSYVRGHWRNLAESSPMILAKSCHDMDILQWLAGDECVRLSSFGTLTHFKKENAPPGAPLRCLDGCPAERECPYNAGVLYMAPNGPTAWLGSVAGDGETDPVSLTRALREGPYGRCVYHCDNDVVDHQVVILEFANQVMATFNLCGFTHEISRTIKLMGTKGEIRGHMERNELEVYDFVTGAKETIHLPPARYGHGDGDYGLMYEFVRTVAGAGESPTSAANSVASHLMAFAAEKARLENRVIDMKGYMKELGG